MIQNDQELNTTLQRIDYFRQQVTLLRQQETNPVNYRSAVMGFLSEIDRMQLEVRDYFLVHPTELATLANIPGKSAA